MSIKTDEIYDLLDEIFETYPTIRRADIPGIDLYMDQVTTFLQDSLRPLSRDPDGDKFLTKTMINNYVKNKVLPPPEKKKYSRDHIMLLLIIYYMKNFLSISDIKAVTGPVARYCLPEAAPAGDKKKEAAGKKRDMARRPGDQARKEDRTSSGKKDREDKPGLSLLYDKIVDSIGGMLPGVRQEIADQIRLSQEEFDRLEGIDSEERALLQQFSLICRLSVDVCVRKLLIEKMIDRDMT